MVSNERNHKETEKEIPKAIKTIQVFTEKVSEIKRI